MLAIQSGNSCDVKHVSRAVSALPTVGIAKCHFPVCFQAGIAASPRSELLALLAMSQKEAVQTVLLSGGLAAPPVGFPLPPWCVHHIPLRGLRGALSKIDGSNEIKPNEKIYLRTIYW